MSIDTIEIFGQIADLKTVDYKNTLAIATLIELLVDKGFFTKHEFARKAAELEGASLADILVARRMQMAHEHKPNL